MARGEQRPLVVRRVVEEGHGGHHGGAWKVAYADFVTAMMAFFLLLWLISSADKDTLKGLAEYFSDAHASIGTPGGNGALLTGRTMLPAPDPPTMMTPPMPLPAVSPASTRPETDDAGPDLDAGQEPVTPEAFEAERVRREQALFDQAKAAIRAALEGSPELKRFEDNVLIDQTPEGLRVQILDRDNAPMFPLGSDQMYPHTRELLGLVLRAVGAMPNRISLRGHTDALPYPPGRGYDNWRLSSDRANATRRAMVELGLKPERVADVTGKGDSENLVPDNPRDPRNRRISLILLHESPAIPGPRAGDTRPATLPLATPPRHPT